MPRVTLLLQSLQISLPALRSHKNVNVQTVPKFVTAQQDSCSALLPIYQSVVCRQPPYTVVLFIFG